MPERDTYAPVRLLLLCHRVLVVLPNPKPHKLTTQTQRLSHSSLSSSCALPSRPGLRSPVQATQHKTKQATGVALEIRHQRRAMAFLLLRRTATHTAAARAVRTTSQRALASSSTDYSKPSKWGEGVGCGGGSRGESGSVWGGVILPFPSLSIVQGMSVCVPCLVSLLVRVSYLPWVWVPGVWGACSAGGLGVRILLPPVCVSCREAGVTSCPFFFGRGAGVTRHEIALRQPFLHCSPPFSTNHRCHQQTHHVLTSPPSLPPLPSPP